MKIELDINETDEAILNALLATGQWGDSIGEVARRLFNQRAWQITGESIQAEKSIKIGSDIAQFATNQVTRPR